MINQFLQEVFKNLSRSLWPTLAWTIIILFFCLMPSSDLPGGPKIPGFDKIGHFGLFFIWAFLLTSYKKSNLLLVCLTGIALGLGIEVLQKVMPMGRSFEWWDLVADALGVISGGIVRAYLTPQKYLNED